MILQSQIFLLQLDPTSTIDSVAVTGLYKLSRQLCHYYAGFESLWGSWTCMTWLLISHEQHQQYSFYTAYRYLQLRIRQWSDGNYCHLHRFEHYAHMSQTSFSLYLHNQWTDFHKLSCIGKSQMRAIRICVGCTKATTNDWDIRPSVAVKALSANISWTAERIHMIELALGSAHQSVSNDIWYVSQK